jgi:hypothetical protein
MSEPTEDRPARGAALARAILADAFDRVREDVPEVVRGLTPDQLLWRPDADANHVAWLVWHLTRVQDDHLAGVSGRDQVWTSGGWAERFGLPYRTRAVGYGQSSDEVGAFVLEDPEVLTGYHAAVHEETLRVIGGLEDEDFARVVDRSWDPPVTAAVRLVSVVNDITQHLGQAAYVRGLIERRN